MWGQRLIAVFGAGLVAGGLFGPDPAFGFPARAAEGMPAAMSAHGAVHAAAFFIGVLSVVAACFVFRSRFAACGKLVGRPLRGDGSGGARDENLERRFSR